MEKWFAKSMTMWGLAIGFVTNFLPSFGPLIGLDIDPGVITDLGDKGNAFIQAAGAFAASVMIFWGRIRASGPLSFLGGGK